MTDALLALAPLVAFAFVVEATLGAGATLITVGLGATFLPIDQLLAIFLPLNVLLSLAIVAKDRRSIARGLLFGRIIPLMIAGLPLGIWVFRTLDGDTLKLVFGASIALLSVLELVRSRETARVIAPGASHALLVAAGAMHGAFATGGPLVVYVLGRTVRDKASFRATLCTVWLVLNLILLGSYAARGTLSVPTLLSSASLLPALAVGLWLGDRIHRRAPLELFRRLVFTLILAAGLLSVAQAV